ncbi:MAG: hypothetical protein V9G29_15335 [Burkholderiaceae bacterium]
MEAAQIESLKSKVLDRLSDPTSAQFRKVKLLKGNNGLCGEINAKNKLGGYVGFSAFAVDSTGKVVILKAMTLEVAKESPENIMKLAVSMSLAGNNREGESLIYDSVESKHFAHWNECEN